MTNRTWNRLVPEGSSNEPPPISSRTPLLNDQRTRMVKILRNHTKSVTGETNVDLLDIINRKSTNTTKNTIALEVTNNYTMWILVVVFALTFVGLVVFIVYDLTIHHGVGIITNAEPTSQEHVVKKLIRQQPIMLEQKTKQTLQNRILVKVLHGEEIWDNYKGLNYTLLSLGHDGTLLMGYNMYSMEPDYVHTTDQCEPIVSSVEVSCCCFFEKFDKMLCNDDNPIRITTPSLPDKNIETRTFKITCELLYGKRGGKSTQHHNPILYLGLSTDYVNQTSPQYFEGFVVDNHNECTLKMSFVCFTVN